MNDDISILTLALAKKYTDEHGGGGGTTDYDDLSNKPQIAGTTLSGNKSLADLGIASAQSVSNITNGESINNFAGVEDALSNKQNKLTAGNYIAIENDGTIKVTQGIGVYDVYSYKIEGRASGTTYWTNVIKYKNGIQQSSNTYYNMESIIPINIDDRLTLQYVRNGVSWHVTLLVDSNEHQAGEDITWKYNVTKDFTETFNVSQDSSTDLATKGDIEAAISSAYHHAGTKTCAELVAGLLVAANEGNVYNMTDSGTTTADFIEGAGQPIKAGDNVGIAKVSDGVYKFDLLSGFVDTTNFVQKSVTAGLLKNDGTVNDEIEGDVDSLKSGLTTLDTEVNGDAVTYPYADVITINDAVPANLADCSVKVEPVQDLHGQSAPYVGGAGKNKLPMTVDGLKAANTDGTWSGDTYTLNGVSFTILKDADGNVTGVKTGNNQTATGGNASFNIVTLSQGVTLDSSSQYIGNGCPANGSTSTYYLRFTGGFDASSDIGEGTGVKTVTTSAVSVYIRVTEGATVSDLVFTPMIRLATETDATFAPYTNICPITGHTSAVAKTAGKNWLDGSSNVAQYSINSTGNIVTGSDRLISDYIKCDNNSNYTVGFNAIMQFIEFVFYDGNRNFISTSYNNHEATHTAQTPSNAKYMRIGVQKNGITTDGFITYQAMLVAGTDVADYAAYISHTYTLALGDTIYGGTVDFETGVMTVDRAIVDLGSLNWTYQPGNMRFISSAITNCKTYAQPRIAPIKCSALTPITDGRPYEDVPDKCIYIADGFDGAYAHDSDYTDGVLFKTAMNGVQLCYELATPTTVQLTPQQIQLLQGTNTLTASTGDISVTVNGVSGAIGAVQEQVNDHEERIEAVESGLTNQGGTITPVTNVTNDTVDYSIINRMGNVVTVFVSLVIGDTISAWTKIANLSARFRPIHTIMTVGWMTTTSEPCLVRIDNDGDIMLSKAVSTGKVQFSVSYIVN